jgi:uncharacterized protein YaiE (UPF0345 family)
MEAGINPEEQQRIIDKIDCSPALAKLLHGIVEAVQTASLSPKSEAALVNANATLPAPGPGIEEMKAVLGAEDCLYDKAEIWRALGAGSVPEIPDSVIREAYEKGGRVVLSCSSISEKATALEDANLNVYFRGSAQQHNYVESVSEPGWIVVQSHIDKSTLGSQRRAVVTSEMPAPTLEGWFAAIAYAILDGNRQPKGCEGMWAFTAERGTAAGSARCNVNVICCEGEDYDGFKSFIGAARFGPPRN